MTRGNKIMWKRGHYFIYIFLTSGVKLHIHLLNVIVQIVVFLTLSTLICRGTDISKHFSESLGIRDSESRMYFQNFRGVDTLGRFVTISVKEDSFFMTSWLLYCTVNPFWKAICSLRKKFSLSSSNDRVATHENVSLPLNKSIWLFDEVCKAAAWTASENGLHCVPFIEHLSGKSIGSQIDLLTF